MNIETPCIINRNEQNSRVLNFKIPAALVDKNVSMAFITPNRVRRSTGLLTVAADGSGSYTLTAEVLDGVGTLAAQLNITDGEGTFVQKSTVYLFTVGRDISEEYAVIGTSTYTIGDIIGMLGEYVHAPADDVPANYIPMSDGQGGYSWEASATGDNVVKYSEQTKTDEEKAQARANIGAVDEADIAEAVTGLASEQYVNTAVGNLDNSLSSVAKSGSYDDLSDTPTALSDFTNDEDFVNREFVNSSIATKQTKPILRTVTLLAASWDAEDLTQTVTVTGVTVTNDIDVASAPSNFEEYGKVGIYAITQAADSVTFKCRKVPESNVTVYVRIWEG